MFLIWVALHTTRENLWLNYNIHLSGGALILFSPQKSQQLWAEPTYAQISQPNLICFPWKYETLPLATNRNLLIFTGIRLPAAGLHFPTIQDSIHCTAAIIPSMSVGFFSVQFPSTLAWVTFLPFFSPFFFFWRDTRSLKGHDLHINHSRAGFREQKLAF